MGLVIPALAQQPPREQDETIKLKTDLVTLTAAVTDGRGRVIKKLKAADFEVYEDGAKQSIELFEPTEEPFTLLLLLDISGSTQDDIELIKRAAKGFLKSLRKDDRIGVIVFSKEIQLIVRLDDTRAQLENAIEQVASAEGLIEQRFTTQTGTSFYDALQFAVDDSQFKRAEGRKALVCMSDGVDSTSRATFRAVATSVEKSDASAYFLAINTQEAMLEGLLKPRTDPGYINFSQSQIERFYDEYDSGSADRHVPRHDIPPLVRREIAQGLYEIADRDMKQLVERIGGHVYAVSALTDLSAVYEQIADSLRSQYLLGYYPKNDAHDGRWRSIKVEVRRTGATVKARSGYWAK